MKHIAISIFLFIATSCNTSFKRQNDKGDINEAKKICENFLSASKLGVDSAYKYIVDVDYQEFKEFSAKSDSLHGKIITFNFVEGQSLVEKKNNMTTGEYVIKMNLIREKRKTTKIIYLKMDDNKIKIISSDETFNI